MHTFLYPIKSTFISSDSELINRNMGGDEVVEIEKLAIKRTPSYIGLNTGSFSYTASFSRTLMKFDISEISASISNGTITSPQFHIVLKTVEATHLPQEYTLLAYPINASWINGTGRKYDDLPADGATWIYRSPKQNFAWTSPGGDFIQQYVASQSFSTAVSSDLRIDITSMAKAWMSSSIQNEGVILMYSSSTSPTSSIDSGKLRYFSPNTNTIYYPYLDVSWNDSQYFTGSLIVESDFNRGKVVKLKNVSPEYKSGEYIRFDILTRDRYPTKTYQSWPTGSVPFNNYISSKILPSSSYYSVVDLYTKHVFIDYSDSTKISCDGTSSYFNLNMGNLPQERYYNIRIKVVENKNFNIYDSDVNFKVIR